MSISHLLSHVLGVQKARLGLGSWFARQVAAPAGQARELTPAVLSALLPVGPMLLLALQLPVVPDGASSSFRDAAFRSLNRCSSSRQPQACADADAALQALIRQQDNPEARERQPRCLGALTQLESVLATFRWRLETNTNLQRAIDAASDQCPPL
jgi:hypothetical protein